ncbi:MAG: class I SAM-dependent methyltransferase [Chloroflexota bacterium]
MPALNIRTVLEYGAGRLLAPLGYELRDRVLSERPEGFAGYLAAARAAAMDVNDFEEQQLGWRLPRPTLDEIAYPYLRQDSKVCEIGPGTGRWSRHILPQIPRGELHLVDPSPWMVRFLDGYFRQTPNVHAHLNDGQSLPFQQQAWLDLIFSANAFVELKLGVIWLYAREFCRALKPGGYAVVDYVDPTTREGWEHLMAQPADLAGVYTFHAPQVIDRVFQEAGLSIERRYQVGKSTFVVTRRRA